jgi:hypothetical protein
MTGTLDGKLIPKISYSLYSLTILGNDFSCNLFSKSFTDENHGKVINRQTYIVITVFIHLMCNKQRQVVKLPSYYHLIPSVTCLKVENYLL